MAKEIREGATFEWFDGDTAEIETVDSDGRVFFRDGDGLHETSKSALRTALNSDSERFALISWNEDTEEEPNWDPF